MKKLFYTLAVAFAFGGAAQSQTLSACPGFKTFTQGGWGSTPNGSNPGTILSNGFSSVFPQGLTIGCTNKIVLTSATAVRNFLPQGSSARMLNAGTLTNPTKTSYSNVLAGQLVAATLSTEFDAKQASFAPASLSLKDLKVSSGPFFDKTVSEVLTLANNFIGGCGSSYTASQFNTILTSLNQSYDNGIATGSQFVCPITCNVSSIDVKCFGGNDGSISLTNVTSGAGGPFTYTWSNGATTASVSNLVAGSYTVVVRDRIGISKSITVVVGQPTQLVANSIQNSQILCYGGTADVVVGANGGTAPYTGTGKFTVTAGTYYYTVTDANGCTSTTQIVVSQPSKLTASTNGNDVLCNGGTTLVNVGANGGTTPYNGTGTFTVSAGTYNYTVTDANGCFDSKSITINEPSALVLNGYTHDDNSCNGGACSGSAVVIANGGTSPYQYAWSSGNSTTDSLGGLCMNDIATVTVTDDNGCTDRYDFDPIACTVIKTNCDALTTFTQGGYGAVPSGNNPGKYVALNFANAFPNGLVIGSKNTLTLTSAQAVENFLPSGGPSRTLASGNTINPTTLGNTLAGQLVAATLSLAFDAYDANFAASTQGLVNRYCNFAPFYGYSITQLVAEANQAIGGNSAPKSLSDYNMALTKFNENYDNGTIDKGDFACAPTTAPSARVAYHSTASEISMYPNPANGWLNVSFTANQSSKVQFNVLNVAGQVVMTKQLSANQGYNFNQIDLSTLNSGLIFVEVKMDNQIVRKQIVLTK